jgi:hypothetical protein
MTNTINAAANPALANNLINQALAETPAQTSEVNITSPSDTSVTLPGGYITATGEVVTAAEVRELNGSDEEAIAKASNIGKAVLTILTRGTVKVGEEKATEQLLDRLLAGDRDMLLLSIFKTTFGKTADLNAFCTGCSEIKVVTIDIDEDIKIKVLADPINDRVFLVKGKKNTFTVQLPTGLAQKEMIMNSEKTAAELNTIMLENAVLKIDDAPVLSKLQVQNLGLLDRRTITEAINNRLVGPQFEEVKVTCPDCESEVSVPVNFGTLFRF